MINTTRQFCFKEKLIRILNVYRNFIPADFESRNTIEIDV